MFDQVGWTLPDAWRLLADCQLQREFRPAEYRHVRSTGMQIVSDGWVDARRSINVRYSRVQSSRIDVATLMIYPVVAADRLPIFGAEWVVVSGRCHLAVLDVEVAGAQPELFASLQHQFAPLAARWQPIFPEREEVPEWFREIGTPWALCSACDLDRLPQLRQAYADYLRLAVEGWYAPACLADHSNKSSRESAPEHPAVLAYKQHHFEHSPGRKLLSKDFAPEFVDAFLRDWHFGPCQSAESLGPRSEFAE
ncbi:hypothetical protein [Tuwongella immobilis]|uniref:Phycocyanobilin:ferredoxin oxidoreductase n=1 Tax=Tuwongella immobilis TaxID=692036 RepID=A0A6C2YHL9_9BACT|nr:hypothetical protein [Tuwongella immobilis]VIP00633.1 phycoerythrobilin:ferredoxin oxidoreductase : Uncharacterized protein OS=Isosphaera pallida (strain ATCC 43644 / DSM 9630 / IS1B) GN=Isop_0940 PE=4 SV=1: Fe_bilin_red [Tuwongella immobilis]VTR96684.1 phycoerythrobilin:ferredoxin oxidoreductase : Uncharacterized protein OS=Isosphaera pallida (strain ATCC 43644 / DSM 9630 / IS1B) GN=Isop_0940 PE=4 SV=1: Fe_bilin_red [Tuwongella immobilis]